MTPHVIPQELTAYDYVICGSVDVLLISRKPNSALLMTYISILVVEPRAQLLPDVWQKILMFQSSYLRLGNIMTCLRIHKWLAGECRSSLGSSNTLFLVAKAQKISPDLL